MTLSTDITGSGTPSPMTNPPERNRTFHRLVRATDKKLLQAPIRLFSGLCDDACRTLDVTTGRWGRMGKPVRAVGTRLVDATRTAVETTTGIVRDVSLTVVEVPAVLLRHVARATRLLRQRQGGHAARELGKAFTATGVRVLGGGLDVVSRGVQGTVNGVLTLTFAEAPSRPLLPDEIRVLKEVYGDSLDYTVVRLKRGGATEWVRMAPHVVGNIVHLTNTWSGRAVFHPDGSLTREGLETLVHEMGHVWQNQNGGGRYMHRALLAQFGAYLRGGERHGAYAWRPESAAGRAFEELNPEQQATLMEEIGVALRDHGQVVPSAWKPPLSPPELRYVLTAWECIRRGEGCEA